MFKIITFLFGIILIAINIFINGLHIKDLVGSVFIACFFIIMTAGLYVLYGLFLRISKNNDFKTLLEKTGKGITNYFLNKGFFIGDAGLWSLFTGLVLWIMNPYEIKYRIFSILAIQFFPPIYVYLSTRETLRKFMEMINKPVPEKEPVTIQEKLLFCAKQLSNEQLKKDIENLVVSFNIINELATDKDAKHLRTTDTYSQELYTMLSSYNKISKNSPDNAPEVPENIIILTKDMSLAFYNIIKSLCDMEMFENDSRIKALRIDMRMRGLL